MHGRSVGRRFAATTLVALALATSEGVARAQPTAFAALTDGATARYQAYLGSQETGETRTTTIAMRLVARASRDARTREFTIEWRDEAGASVSIAPLTPLPTRLVVTARGLSFDAVTVSLPSSFESLGPRPARVPANRYVTYTRESLGCIEREHPGTDPADFVSVRACFASDGLLREFVFDSGNLSIELAGPITRPSDVVGAWSTADAASDRRFAARLRLDEAGRVVGTYTTESAWSTECAVTQIDDASRPEVVPIHLRCVDHIVGDEGEIEEGDCALLVVGGELVLDRCSVVDARPMTRDPSATD